MEGKPQIGLRLGPVALRYGVADPYKYATPNVRVLSCRIWSFYVKRYERY